MESQKYIKTFIDFFGKTINEQYLDEPSESEELEKEDKYQILLIIGKEEIWDNPDSEIDGELYSLSRNEMIKLLNISEYVWDEFKYTYSQGSWLYDFYEMILGYDYDRSVTEEHKVIARLHQLSSEYRQIGKITNLDSRTINNKITFNGNDVSAIWIWDKV